MIEDKLILAPLAGYTDKAFRQICTSFGADITVTEMVSAEGLSRDSVKTEELLERFEGEDRLIVQLFAPNEDPVRRCIKNLMKYNPTQIDINCGCPVPKVVKTGAGSALMLEPEKIKRICKVIKEETNLPLSVKFRLGWDSNSINYLEFADMAVEGGADALTLHARTRAQGYAGVADREAFRTLAHHMMGSGVKTYGSGDVFTAEDAIRMIEEYKMDGVMFARGAIGNPFIFRETRSYIEKGEYEKPGRNEVLETAMRHFDLMVHYYGENLAGREMRKHMMAYLKGMSGAKESKAALTSALTRDDYLRSIEPLMI
ncbi:MAG: tRNA dihydrouridine synthase DusB [Spirochaetales bacterium]|nr:tRNA dihydrouridine synthase DusB [Spirochaetales bacterium]